MNTEISGFSSPSRQEHMNQVLAPMVAVSRDGIITYANTRAVKDFDHNLPENIINRHINEFLSVKDQNRFREILKETVAASKKLENGEKTQNVKFPEVEIRTVSGKERFLRITPKFIRAEDQSKRIIGSEILITDITEEIKQKALAEAVKIVGESKLNKDDVLRKIRSILKTILPHDTANLMLFDDLRNQKRLTMHDKWGYGEEGTPTSLDFTP